MQLKSTKKQWSPLSATTTRSTQCDFLFLVDVNEWINSECSALSVPFLISSFLTYILVHIHQKGEDKSQGECIEAAKVETCSKRYGTEQRMTFMLCICRGPMVLGTPPSEASDRLQIFQARFDELWRKYQTYSGKCTLLII